MHKRARALDFLVSVSLPFHDFKAIHNFPFFFQINGFKEKIHELKNQMVSLVAEVLKIITNTQYKERI